MSRNKEQEIKDVREAIKSIANDIVASKGTKGHTNETYDEEIKKAEFMLQSLCEMYHIAHYR